MNWRTMPFGKHKGQVLAQLPDDYLDWLIAQDFCREPLRRYLRDEHDRRLHGDRGDRHSPPGTNFTRNFGRREREIASEIVTSGYKALSRKLHPDVGGNHEDMVALNRALTHIRKLLGDG